MGEEQISEVLRRLESMTNELHSCSREVSNLSGIVDQVTNRTIEDLKNRVTELEKKHSKDVSELYQLMRDHEKDNHSSNSSRDSWVAIAVIFCTIATFLSPFIQKWIG